VLPPVADNTVDRALLESTVPAAYVRHVAEEIRSDARGRWKYQCLDVTLPPDLSWPKLRTQLVSNLAGQRLSILEERGAAPGSAHIRIAQQSRVIASAVIHPMELQGSEPPLDEEGAEEKTLLARANSAAVPTPIPEPAPVPQPEPVSAPRPEAVPSATPAPETTPVLSPKSAAEPQPTPPPEGAPVPETAPAVQTRLEAAPQLESAPVPAEAPTPAASVSMPAVPVAESAAVPQPEPVAQAEQSAANQENGGSRVEPPAPLPEAGQQPEPVPEPEVAPAPKEPATTAEVPVTEPEVAPQSEPVSQPTQSAADQRIGVPGAEMTAPLPEAGPTADSAAETARQPESLPEPEIAPASKEPAATPTVVPVTESAAVLQPEPAAKPEHSPANQEIGVSKMEAPVSLPEAAPQPQPQPEPEPALVPEIAPVSKKPAETPEIPVAEAPAAPQSKAKQEPAEKMMLASAAGGRPRVAVILDDGGYGGADTEQALALDTKVTLAILPNTPSGRDTAKRAVTKGFEVMLHMPMETAVKGIRAVTGQLDTSMDQNTIHRLTLDALSQVPGAKGVNYHTGGKFIQDYARTRWFMEVVRDKQLYFVDSRTTGRSVGHAAAMELGVRAADRDVFLDNESSPDYIRRQFELLVDGANKRGAAVGIGHFRRNTVAVLHEMLPKLSARGLELVHVSELLP